MDGAAFTDWFTDTTLLGISLSSWAIAAAVAFGSFLAMSVALRVGLRRADRVARQTSNQVDDIAVRILRGTKAWLLALAALLIGLGLLDLPERWSARVGQLWFLAIALQLALWINTAVGIGLDRYVARHSSAGMNQVSASATLMSWGARTVLWTVVLLAMLSNLGVNITAFVASLGVGGIAVALAVQNILGDLFASLAIAVDKPFEVGDAISVNGVSGTVELVGLKTTRIRASGGEQVVMSNTELLKNTINNYKRLAERRIVFKFGVAQHTTPEQAEQIPGIVRRLVEGSEGVRFDRAHFQGFGPNSLDYEVVYIVLTSDYNLYMNTQQAINLQLMRELARLGVALATPTRMVLLSEPQGGAAQPLPNRGARPQLV